MTALEAAYRDCERVTRAEATNFYYGIRLLPADKRRAMCAVYAFARWIDDIGDGTLDPAAKATALADARRALAAPPTGEAPLLLALDDAARRFDLPRDALVDLIDGVEMDLADTRYEHFSELVVYCRRVAGSIGRLCLAIFGADERERALSLSDDLGVALQLTNILRDVREDLERGRVYLPAEDLRRFGCADLDAADPRLLAELVRFQADRAREWFERGLALLTLLDRRSASCAAAMSGIYQRVLVRIERDPAVVLRQRVALPPWEKAWVASSSLTRALL